MTTENRLTSGPMSKVVEIEKVSDEGLQTLLGQQVIIWCECYIYHGTLMDVSETDVLLNDAKVVYQTGALKNDSFEKAEALRGPWYIRVAKIESYGPWPVA